jgi:tRNA-dihydrouridine synthase B
MKIDEIFDQNFVLALAPMEPITTNPIIREISSKNGAQIVFRPKIMPHHLLKARQWQFWEKIKEIKKIRTPSNQNVFDGIQLIARPGDPIKAAVKYINNNYSRINVSFIDLNFCCPGHKMRKKDRGGELLQHPEAIFQVIEESLKYSDLPITLKIRKGYTQNDSPFNLCRGIQKEFSSNIKWIAVNRAPVRMKDVSIQDIESNFEIFNDTINAVEHKIPIIANGGVKSLDQYLEIKNHTKCSGIMIGRAALGDHRIFKKFQEENNDMVSNYDDYFATLIDDLFQTVNKYRQGPSGRWCSIGPLKQMLFYYIKQYYEIQLKQIPKGYGFSKWNKTQFSIEQLIQTLGTLFPKITKKKWTSWLIKPN